MMTTTVDKRLMPQEQQQQQQQQELVKQGWLRKKGSRYGKSKQWSERYFILRDSTLSYYLRRADVEPKGEFIISSQCSISPITIESKSSKASCTSKESTISGVDPQRGIPSNDGNSAANTSSSTGADNSGSSKHSRKSKKDNDSSAEKAYYCFKISFGPQGPDAESSNSPPSPPHKDVAIITNSVAPNSNVTVGDGGISNNNGTVVSFVDDIKISPPSPQKSVLKRRSAPPSSPSTPKCEMKRVLSEEWSRSERSSPPNQIMRARSHDQEDCSASVSLPSNTYKKTIHRRHKSLNNGNDLPIIPDLNNDNIDFTMVDNPQGSGNNYNNTATSSSSNYPQPSTNTALVHIPPSTPTKHTLTSNTVAPLEQVLSKNSSYLLALKKEKTKKTRKRLVMGTKAAVATGATVTAAVVTAGGSLAAGLAIVAITAAAGGSSEVASRTFSHFKNNKNGAKVLVLSCLSLREAEGWVRVIQGCIDQEEDKNRNVPESTWASLFKMDGHDPNLCLQPTHNKSNGLSVEKGVSLGGGGGDRNDGVERGVANEGAGSVGIDLVNQVGTRWKPVEGGWAALLGMGANGLRIYEEDVPMEIKAPVEKRRGMGRLINRRLSVKGQPCPPLKAQVILDATPLNAFMCLMSHARIGRRGSFTDMSMLTPASHQRASFRIIETLDDHMDIIHLVFRPIYLFPSWTAPRDYCVFRYWRFEDDGSYIVCYDSVKHRECPPNNEYVRGELHGVYTVAPMKESEIFRQKSDYTRSLHSGDAGINTTNAHQCLLTHIVQVDPRGWVPTIKMPPLANQGYAEAFAVSALLQSLDVRDALTNDRFVSVSHNQNTPYQISQSKKERLQQQSNHGPIHNVQNDTGLRVHPGATSESEDVLIEHHDVIDDGQHGLQFIESIDSADEHNDNINYDFSYSREISVEDTETNHLSPTSATSKSENDANGDLITTEGESIASSTKQRLISVTPLPLYSTMCAEPDANSFMIRGKTYIKNKKKIHAGESLFRLLATDIVEVEAPIMKGICNHPKERVQMALARERQSGKQPGETGDMPPFVFALNIILPGPPYYHLVMYYAVDDMSLIDGSSGTGSSKLANEFFFGDSDEKRDKTFKLIPQIVEGNFVVRRAVGSTPVITGTKLTQKYIRNDRFFELILDVGSSSVAVGVVRLSLGYAKTLVVDMAFLLEGSDESTLPEEVMGCVRLKNVDFGAGMRFCDPLDDSDD